MVPTMEFVGLLGLNAVVGLLVEAAVWANYCFGELVVVLAVAAVVDCLPSSFLFCLPGS